MAQLEINQYNGQSNTVYVCLVTTSAESTGLDTWQVPNPAHHPAVPTAEAAALVITDIHTIPTYYLLLKCIVWLTFISGEQTWGPAQRDVERSC